ncbi:MAG: PmbA protein [Myxococcota bacterium]|jgi:PmbA protein
MSQGEMSQSDTLDPQHLQDLAGRVCEMARRHGADHAAASASSGRSYKVVIRDGEVEELKASVSSGLSVKLYVNGRYGAHWTSEVDTERLDAFVSRALDMTKILTPDEHRKLPDPALYADRKEGDLGCFDPDWTASTPEARKSRAVAAYEAARDAVGDAGPGSG